MVHGTKLIDIEKLTIATNTFLFEDDGSGIFKKDERSDDNAKKDANEAADKGAKDIHDAFDDKFPIGEEAR